MTVQWSVMPDFEDAEINMVPCVENPELTNGLPLKLAVGQNITTHASPTASNFFLVLISPFTTVLSP